MLFSAQPYLSVTPDELDAHRMLLNCNNGIIDLTTGNLLPHDRKYMLTKMVTVDYIQDAECPHWIKFLRMITGEDEELQLFLQLCVGYTLTGRTDEHVLFFYMGQERTVKQLLPKHYAGYSRITHRKPVSRH